LSSGLEQYGIGLLGTEQ